MKSRSFAFYCKAGSCPAQSAPRSISWVTPLHLPLILPAASPQRSPSCRSSSHQHPPGSWHPPSHQGTALKSATPPCSSSSPAPSVSCPTEGALAVTGHLRLLPIHVPCLLSRWHCWLKLGHKQESHRLHRWDALRSIPTLHLCSLPITQPAAEGAESAGLLEGE